MDAENTEQDVSAAGESLENLADNDGIMVMGGGDAALEEIMDHGHSHVSSHALVEALIVAAENPSQMETEDDTAHDSQMRTHNESEFIGGDDAHYGDDHHDHQHGDSSDSDSQSQSESGHSDDDDDEADDDEDDDDDDGAEEETEEEGEGEDDVEEEEEETEAEEGEEENASGYGEDGDRYPELLRDFLTRGATGAGDGVEDALVFSYPDAENSAAGLGFGGGLGLGRLGGGVPLFLDDTFRSHMLPYPGLLDEANGNDATAAATGTASVSRLNALAHPLLVGRQPAAPDASASAASGRNRGGRQRGYRYLQPGSRIPNPPAILQRLLGPSATQDVLQLTGGQSLGFGRESRVFLVDNGLGILANAEDDNLLDIQDQMGGVLVGGGGMSQSGLVQTPSALNRWMEEAIILDADSIHDCIAAIKPDILTIVDKERDEELAERRERRKKQQEEEAARRKKEEEEAVRDKSKEGSAVPSTTASTAVPAVATMEVGQPQQESSAASGTTTAAPSSSTGATGASAASEAPSFSSFFHGFNMHSTPTSLMTSTPLIRSRDHAETLATSIVEAVLGPALETVAGQVPRPGSDSNSNSSSGSSSRDPQPESVQPMQEQSSDNSSGMANESEAGAARMLPPPAPINLPADEEARPSDSMMERHRPAVESTPIPVDRSSEFVTPFNPIPNPTPGAPQIEDRYVNSSPLTFNPENRIPARFLADAFSVQELEAEATEEETRQNAVDAGATASGSVSADIGEQGAVAAMGAAAATATAEVATNRPSEYQSLLGNIEIPEGVDPSFLAALPEDMRQEVIAEQLRLQRLRQRARAQASDATNQVTLFCVNSRS